MEGASISSPPISYSSVKPHGLLSLFKMKSVLIEFVLTDKKVDDTAPYVEFSKHGLQECKKATVFQPKCSSVLTPSAPVVLSKGPA